MDLYDLDIFERYSTGTFALISGMAIIGTVTYFIYVIMGLEQWVFFYSVLAFILGVFIAPFFFLEDLTGSSDIIGKFLSGVVAAAIVWIGYQSGTSQNLSGIELTLYIVLPAIFTFITSLLLTRGVLVPMIEGGELGGGREWSGTDYEEDEWEEEEFDEDIEDEYEEETEPSSVERRAEEHREKDLFPEEEDSW
ncbi:MAG: hypothetical protein R6U61_03160 [Thermoplasmata archaeon]